MRQRLRPVIEIQPDLQVLGEAGIGIEVVEAARRLIPDIIVVEIRVLESAGIHATQAITADPALRRVRVLVLSMYELDEYVYGALRAGASGFLLKDAHPDTLLDAIYRVHSGEVLFAPSILATLIDHYIAASHSALRTRAESGLAVLIRREIEILAAAATRPSNEDIAAEFSISGNTVKTHCSSLLSMLHARDRAQLVITAYECGFTVARGFS